MTWEPLASVADVVARLGRTVTDEEEPRIAAFLDDVSALVADHCGTDFRWHDGALVQLDATAAGAELPLPRFMLPISDITEVRWASGAPVDGWTHDGLALWRPYGWTPPQGASRRITVRATYGYPAVPRAVVSVVCAEVIRWLAVEPGVASERVGELERHYGATAPSQGLSPAAREGLRRYRRTLVSREVRRPAAVV
ncbi:phage gp6-like head-tail connector protein [Streptomyces chrestomyceticus]|uniref:phage gp6-like head-tail connector protein n=1 Tax=Streptomyces chrestomyceticus TaxID=68185 RepID=UPI0033C2E437